MGRYAARLGRPWIGSGLARAGPARHGGGLGTGAGPAPAPPAQTLPGSARPAPARPAPARPPVLAGTGPVIAKVLRTMRLDKDLDVGAAGTALLATVLDSAARFMFFEAWPFLSCMLCMMYNEDYMDACLAFLRMAQDDLDVGFGQVLQRIALSIGPLAMALNWLVSPTVQATLVHVFESGAASSLPVERKHTQTKRFEASRLLHLAVAGRNQMHRALLRLQADARQQREAAETELAAAKKTNIWSLAWQKQPALADAGVDTRYGEPERQPAPRAGRQQDAPETPKQRLRTFVRENRAELVEARLQRIQAAKLRVASLPPRDVPLTYDEWLAWVRANEVYFQPHEPLRGPGALLVAASRPERTCPSQSPGCRSKTAWKGYRSTVGHSS